MAFKTGRAPGPLKPFAVLLLTAAFFSTAYAGASNGPQYFHDNVKEGSRMVYRIAFREDVMARVEAKTDNSADDIDLYVYNSDGELVTKNVLDDGDPTCSWKPSDSTEYTIKVVNNAHHAVDYRLTTN